MLTIMLLKLGNVCEVVRLGHYQYALLPRIRSNALLAASK